MPEITSYPRLRPNRIGGESLLASEGFTFPRSRVFSFNMSHNTNGNRQTISFGPCRGPALIKNIRLRWAVTTDPPRTSLEVGYARVPIFENTVASTLPRPYTLLTENNDQLGFLPFSTGEGILNTTYTADASGAWELNFVVNEAQFYPCVSLWVGSANTYSNVGHLTVIENIDPRALASFL